METKTCVSIQRFIELVNEISYFPLSFLKQSPAQSNIIIEYPVSGQSGIVTEVSKRFHKSNTTFINYISLQNLTSSCFIDLKPEQLNELQFLLFKKKQA